MNVKVTSSVDAALAADVLNRPSGDVRYGREPAVRMFDAIVSCLLESVICVVYTDYSSSCDDDSHTASTRLLSLMMM